MQFSIFALCSPSRNIAKPSPPDHTFGKTCISPFRRASSDGFVAVDERRLLQEALWQPIPPTIPLMLPIGDNLGKLRSSNLTPKNCFNGSQRHATPFLTESKTAIQDQRTAKDMPCARRWKRSTRCKRSHSVTLMYRRRRERS